MKFTATITLLLLLVFTSQAQTLKTIEEMDAKYQACIDSGVDMLGCSVTFYSEMDSIVNVVYRKLTASLNPKEKASLIKEQTSWLKKRDVYFKRKDRIFDNNYEKGACGQDMLMITYDEKASFIKKRGIELIKRLNRIH